MNPDAVLAFQVVKLHAHMIPFLIVELLRSSLDLETQVSRGMGSELAREQQNGRIISRPHISDIAYCQWTCNPAP